MFCLRRFTRILLLLFALGFSPSLFAYSFDYGAKLNLSTHDNNYSLGILQANFYKKQILANNDLIAFNYDTDAVFTQYSYSRKDWNGFYFGPRFKYHFFDWQNVVHRPNNQGVDQKDRQLRSSYLAVGGSAGVRFKGHHVGLYYERQSADLKRIDNNSFVPVNDPSFNTIAGLWSYADRTYYTNYRFDGYSVWTEVKAPLVDENYVLSTPAATITGQDTQAPELTFGAKYSRKINSHFLMFAGKATLFAYGQDEYDPILATNLGSGEINYNRLAGYAFSEIRATHSFLVNADYFHHLVGGLYLWLVLDGAVVDKANVGDAVHLGSGAGLHYDIIRKLSIFARFDLALTADRPDFMSRSHLYFGAQGVF